MEKVFHMNAFVFQSIGFLIQGNAGAGKSDLTLRMINHGGILISDDYTQLSIRHEELLAEAPTEIHGKLEVRGIGIINLPYELCHNIKVSIQLCEHYERLPKKDFFKHESVTIPQFHLNPFETSICDKIKIIAHAIKTNSSIYYD